MKKVNYNYSKPQNYYNRLLTFFAFIALSLTFSLVKFRIEDIDLFFLKFIIILFLLLFISVLIEFYYKSDYMNPIEIFNVEKFVNKFLESAYINDTENFFHKYDLKSKKRFKKIFNKNSNFFLSSIRKHKHVYEVTIINNKRLMVFLFSRLLGRSGIHKLFIRRHENNFKIVRFE